VHALDHARLVIHRVCRPACIDRGSVLQCRRRFVHWCTMLLQLLLRHRYTMQPLTLLTLSMLLMFLFRV